ncbi:endonuclease V [Pseudoalteromonas arctica]|uniref:endonuclease V n=1 Tax=Pseudoalteromonas arctica TaxID=394751 RepID=UPI001B7D662B|nr:endonuclease V [Pseudoalteromonas arctica]
MAVDVQYYENYAVIAGITFNNWTDKSPLKVYKSIVHNLKEYIPGEFYKRELPCILQLLEEHQLSIQVIVIDGYVYLDGESKPGLGKYLNEQLPNTKIIGVAKGRFDGISERYAIKRGASKKPLYITSIGFDVLTANFNISSMHGEHRIPTLLKLVDQLCRERYVK